MSSAPDSTISTHGGAVFSGDLSAQRDINITHVTTIRPIAHDLHRSFFTSSDIFAQVQSELALLLVALDTMGENLEGTSESNTSKLFSDIDEKLRSCHRVLLDLQAFKDNFESVGLQTQVTWERMEWKKDELGEIRARISSYVSLLNLLNVNMIKCSQAHVEHMLKAFIAELREGKREKSSVSNDSLSTNGRKAWREFRKELESVGISHDMFIRNRRFIVKTLERALVDENLGEFGLDIQDMGDSDSDDEKTNERPQTADVRASSGSAVSALTAWVSKLNGFAKMLSKIISSEAFLENLEANDDPVLATRILQHCARKGNSDLAKKCLAKGADPNARNRARETALTLAAAAGHAEVVQLLIDNGAEVNQIDPEDEKDATALHKAAERRRREVVQVLLVNGANVNVKDFWGDGPLHKAAKSNDPVMTQLMLRNGAIKDSKARSLSLRAGTGLDAWRVLSDWDG